jgi:hypothetical protein
MKTICIYLLVIFITINGYAQILLKKNHNLKTHNILISDIYKIRELNVDTIVLYEKTVIANKFSFCKLHKSPTYFSMFEQKRYRWSKLEYELYVINDSSYFFLHKMLDEISLFFQNKFLIGKNVYFKNNQYLIRIGNKSNLKNDFELYWYKNDIYMIVYKKKSTFFGREIGDFQSLSIQFKNDGENIDFFTNSQFDKSILEQFLEELNQEKKVMNQH